MSYTYVHINTIFLLMGFTRTKQNCISIVIPLATHSNGLLFYKIVTFWCKLFIFQTENNVKYINDNL